MKVTEFVVFCPSTGAIVKDFTARVRSRNIETANDLVMLVAEKLAWTGASSVDVVCTDDAMHLSVVYPGGNGYRIAAQ